jgi:hypothetical protein
MLLPGSFFTPGTAPSRMLPHLRPKSGDRSRNAVEGTTRTGTGHELGKGDRSMNGSVENDLSPFTGKTSRTLLVILQYRGLGISKNGYRSRWREAAPYGDRSVFSDTPPLSCRSSLRDKDGKGGTGR